jgi:hypothetical protein
MKEGREEKNKKAANSCITLHYVSHTVQILYIAMEINAFNFHKSMR